MATFDGACSHRGERAECTRRRDDSPEIERLTLTMSLTLTLSLTLTRGGEMAAEIERLTEELCTADANATAARQAHALEIAQCDTQSGTAPTNDPLMTS